MTKLKTVYKRKRQDGTGYVYLDPGKTIYKMAYRVKTKTGSRQVRRSTGMTTEADALKVLNDRTAKVTLNLHPDVTNGDVKIDEFYKLIERDYKKKLYRSLDDLETRWELHIQPFFGGMRATDITSQMLDQYEDQRLGEDAAPATISREFAALKRMYKLGCRLYSNIRPPIFPESSAPRKRTGFLEDDVYFEMVHSEPLWFRAIVCCGRSIGWRHDELLALRVRNLHFPTKRIRLEPGRAKNKEERYGIITAEMRELLKLCVEGKGPNDYVFTDGDPKKPAYMRETLYRAAIRAGMGNMYCLACKKELKVDPDWHEQLDPLDTSKQGPTCSRCDRVCYLKQQTFHGFRFHDLRRTAVRVLVSWLGLDRKVAAEIIGWKTPAMVDYYLKLDDRDLDRAERLLSAHQARVAAEYRESLAGEHSVNTPNDFADLAANGSKVQ
jgi:integrase